MTGVSPFCFLLSLFFNFINLVSCIFRAQRPTTSQKPSFPSGPLWAFLAAGFPFCVSACRATTRRLAIGLQIGNYEVYFGREQSLVVAMKL